MKIFVINLPEDVERRRRVEEQLQRFGLAYEVVPAVKGGLLGVEQRATQYDDVRFARNEGRSALPGELGCALSHVGVYRRMLELGLPFALILEDDAWLNPNVPQLLEAIERQRNPESREVILLTWVAEAAVPKLGFVWSSYYLSEIRAAWCTHGYVVTRAAAAALVEQLYPVRHLADCWNWLHRHRIVRVLAVSPTCITCDLSHETRTTGVRLQPAVAASGAGRLAHKVRRAFWRCTDLAVAVVRRLGRSA